MPAKKQDVARTTILVLLVLTILLSVISTWYVLDMITSVKQQYEAMPSITHAQVNVKIAEPGESTAPKGIATGRITFGIIK